MNFLELCQATRQECGIQGSGPVDVENRSGLEKKIVDWVAKADLTIQNINSDWDFLWSEFTADTVVGSDTITKPNDLGIWDREAFAIGRGTATGTKLYVMTLADWRIKVGKKENETPSQVTIFPNGNLRFLEPANAVYSIYGNYWKRPTKLLLNNDTSDIPQQFHQIIIERAKMFFFEDQEGWDNYKAAATEFKNLLEQLEGQQLPGQQWLSQTQPEPLVMRAV